MKFSHVFNGFLPPQSNSSIIRVEPPMFGVFIEAPASLRDGILTAKNKGYSNLEIKGDSKIVVDCYNKRTNILSSIMLLIEDFWKLSQGLHIYECVIMYIEMQIEL